MIVQGYAAHFGRTNLNGEQVTPHAFDAALDTYKALGRYPFLNFNHRPDLIIGTITEMHTDEVGLHITAEVSDASPFAAIVANAIKDGTLDSFSTEGYIDDVSTNSDGTYTAGQFFITAVAVVPNPADPDATFTHNAQRPRLAFLGAQQAEPTRNNVNHNHLIFLL